MADVIMPLLLGLAIILCLVSGYAWLAGNRSGQVVREQLAAERSAREQGQQQQQQLLTQLERLQQENRELQQQALQLQTEQARLEAGYREREAGHRRQQEQLEQQKKQLAQEFENLANRIFDEKKRDFSHSSQQSIEQLLKPFREQIEAFQKRVNDVHSETLRGNTTLEAEIRKVLEVGLKMQDEAGNLARALKGDSQQRGAWGEAQLERTLQMSGLVENAHYEKQTAFKDGEGRSRQTDYLIKLPDGKHIIIDSKVTLNAYDRLIAADNEQQQALALDEHVQAVKKHIDDLAGKDYSNLIGVRSPSFVLMFMPIEPAYIEALKHQKDLFGYGYNKNVILVSHTTLVPVLRTVANLWMLDQSNKEAREISERAGDIFNQVCLVADRLHKLGGTLGTVTNHYNNTVKALVGQQGLYGKVERFGQLSSKASKQLPPLEPLHNDHDVERLQIIELVEPPADELSAPDTSEDN
ncbi:MAG TPA: DNA recombination protein RmuC [Pseudomonadales bacterium]